MTTTPRDDRARAATGSTSIKDGDLRTPLPLDEFMLQLGTVMRLPPKPVETTPETPATTTRRGTRLWLPAAATAVALVVAATQLRPSAPAPVPQEIVGTWETSDPRYAGRQLVLTSESVIEATGNGVLSQPERVSAVQAARRGDTLAVTITHEADGAVASLSLAHIAGFDEHIILRNPAGVSWYRAQDPANVRPAPASRSTGTESPTPPPSTAPGKKPWEH
ncbi:MAG: hypothetical protein U0163_06425 [Gemmatimonadaceae bacterium]